MKNETSENASEDFERKKEHYVEHQTLTNNALLATI